MGTVNSAMWSVLSEPASSTSTGPTNVVTITVPAGASAVLLSAETTAARVTFGNVDPGNATGPGLVVPAGTAPLLFPIAVQSLRFASAAAGSSTLSPTFLH